MKLTPVFETITSNLQKCRCMVCDSDSLGVGGIMAGRSEGRLDIIWMSLSRKTALSNTFETLLTTVYLHEHFVFLIILDGSCKCNGLMIFGA